MKNRIAIIGGVILLIALGTTVFLRTLPNKVLDKEVVALTSRLGGDIAFNDVEFNSQFFPTVITLKDFSFKKSSIYGELDLLASSAEIRLVNQEVDEIALTGVKISSNAQSQQVGAGVGDSDMFKITTDEVILVDVSDNKGELIAIKLPQKFKASSLLSVSEVEYVGKSPVVTFVFDSAGELTVLDYKDNGITIATGYGASGLDDLAQKSIIDPIRILYKKEEQKGGIHTRLEVKAAMPKSSGEVSDLSGLSDEQKKIVQDVIFFSDLGVDVNMSLYGDKKTKQISFIKLEKFNIAGRNFALDFSYNGGMISSGSAFPNGSGELAFSNYQEFLDRLKGIYKMSQNAVGQEGVQSGADISNMLMMLGASVSGVDAKIDQIKRFAAEINNATSTVDFDMEYAFVPPFTFIVNDKPIEELLEIWGRSAVSTPQSASGDNVKAPSM